METPEPPPGPTPSDEQHLAALTGMTEEAARTFLEFHAGVRWLRRDPD
jgi:hypothetical protein